MADEVLQRDQNHVPVIGLITDDSNEEVRMGRIDDATKAMKVTANFPGNTDGQIKITSADTTFGYIGSGKLVAGTGITLTVNNPGGNETLTISAASAGYNTIEEDGTPFTQRTVINFTHGFDVSDSSLPARTNIAIDEGELDLGLMGGLLDLSTQVTGQLSATYIDITDLESTLDLANIAGQIDLTTQVTGLLDVANIDVVSLANDATFISNLEPNLDLGNLGGQIDLASQVTGVLPLANGGTGENLSDPNYDAVWVWDDTMNAVRLANIVGITYDSATNTLTASGTPYSLDVQQDGVSVETGVDTINFTGNVTVTNPSAGQVDVQIGTSTVYVTAMDDFVSDTEVNDYRYSGNFTWQRSTGTPSGFASISETNHLGIITLVDNDYSLVGFYDDMDGQATTAGLLRHDNDYDITILSKLTYSGTNFSCIWYLEGADSVGIVISGTTVSYNDGTGVTGTAVSVPSSGTWFKVRFVMVSGTITMYINNTVVYTGAITVSGNAFGVNIRPTADTQLTSLKIDYVQTNYTLTR